MNPIFLLLALSLSLALAFYVASPLRSAPATLHGVEERAQHRELLERAELLRREERELEADKREGKLAFGDYETMKAETSRASDEVRQQLAQTRIERVAAKSALQAATPPGMAPGVAPIRARLELEIEAEVAIMRARLNAQLRWTCAACSRKMNAQDKFCASCGAAKVSVP